MLGLQAPTADVLCTAYLLSLLVIVVEIVLVISNASNRISNSASR